MKLKIKKNQNIFAATGSSTKNNSYEAAQEAVNMAIDGITKKGAKEGPDFAIIFCNGNKYANHEKSINNFVKGIDEALKKSNPNCKWVGCTSEAELSNYGFSKESCVVMVIKSEFIHFGTGVGKNIYKNPEKATKSALKTALKEVKIDKYVDPYIQFTAMKKKSPSELIKYNPYGIINICAGPLKSKPGNEEDILDIIKSQVGINIPIIGGSASDDIQRMEKVYQFCNGKSYKEAVVITSFVSHLKFGFGTQHGFKPSDKTFLVTESEGRVIKKINNKPAAEVMANAYNMSIEELSEWIAEGMQKCMVLNFTNPILVAEGRNMFKSTVFHAVQGKNIIVGTSIPKNSALTIGEGTRKTIIEASSKAINEATKYAGADPEFALFFDCCLREMALKEKITDEVKHIKQKMGDKPFIGFYTFGEQGYLGNQLTCHVNLTFTSLIFSNKLITED
ncbi:hypothetical protein GF327_06255 [Candidatus Woesearchaeota archaeon]|nr:hypothetical protein [Candidatus Woesearchaeota archaeon]